MRTEEVWRSVLDEQRYPTVLLDLGAAAGPPEIWNAIARSCTYLAFEPDPRSQGNVPPAAFKTAVTIPAAATDVDQRTVRLYLTRSAFCSSTLAPDEDGLRGFVFAPLFDVETTDVVPAMTIDHVLRSEGLNRVHWFKADTQGTDLRLFRSMSSEVRCGVLAVDVEPGLINAYQGEDLFSEAHEYFTANGFWLSSLKIGTNARGSRQTLSRILAERDATPDSVPHRYRQTPVCCEARYLRALVPGLLGRDDLAVLATFAAMDNQPVFAIEAMDLIPHDHRSAAIERLANLCASAVRETPPASSDGLMLHIGRRMERWRSALRARRRIV